MLSCFVQGCDLGGIVIDHKTVLCRYSVVNLLTNIHKRHPTARPNRARYGVYFVVPAYDWYTASVSVTSYVISWNIGSQENVTNSEHFQNSVSDQFHKISRRVKQNLIQATGNSHLHQKFKEREWISCSKLRWAPVLLLSEFHSIWNPQTSIISLNHDIFQIRHLPDFYYSEVTDASYASWA